MRKFFLNEKKLRRLFASAANAVSLKLQSQGLGEIATGITRCAYSVILPFLALHSAAVVATKPWPLQEFWPLQAFSAVLQSDWPLQLLMPEQ
jgi:hypothetical protein